MDQRLDDRPRDVTSRCPAWDARSRRATRLIVSSFHTALFHQFIAVFVLGALCAIGFNVFRTAQYRKPEGPRDGVVSLVSVRTPPRAGGPAHPPHRLRRTLDLRRAAADPVLHAPRTPVGGDPAVSQRVPGLGAAPCEHAASPSGRTIRSRRRRPPCGSRSGSACGCWSPHAAGGLGSADWRRSAGASWSGPSARRSAASSPRG